MEKNKIKILVVDDHVMIRDGIRSMLAIQEKYKFILDEAGSGEEGVEKAKANKYDLIVMDYQLPKMNGVEATKKIIKANPNAKILAMSSYDEKAFVNAFLKSGAKGFVVKSIGPDELVKAFETILGGSRYFSNEIAAKLILVEEENILYKPQKKHSGFDLTERDKVLISLVANGYSNEEIAEKLFISKHAIDKHRFRVMKKLGVKNAAGVAKIALELNLLD